MNVHDGSEARKSTKCKYPLLPPGEEIVISGIAGRFPECDNMREFKENLLNKKDLITEDTRRWDLKHPDIPERSGKVNNLDKLDADFFDVDFKTANCMDPQCRMLMEHTFEAIVDAGINPIKLRGSRTGVYIGLCYCESQAYWIYENMTEHNSRAMVGCHKGLVANRISYMFGFQGPSYIVDAACSSSLYAVQHAYRAIREGACDSAIVAGSNICLYPWTSLHFSRLGLLAMDGHCKAFDENANGYVRSEAIGVILLQRAKDAHRIYGTVLHAKTNCDGYKEQGITFPSDFAQAKLLAECYEECGLPPTILNYMEAHGTGTVVGDPEELNAIDRVFCSNRTTPLRIGSVKSNLGHSEPASGICAISKVVTAMECGLIPPNINFNEPRKDVKALQEGKIVVISEPTPWEGGYVGINSFGFGGANAHVIMKSHTKEKINHGAPQDDLPRLVAVSGRTEEAITTILDDIENRPVDAEYIALYHEIFEEDIFGHWHRGYTIVGLGDTVKPLRKIENFTKRNRPVWFLFSGIGSEWPGMGTSLLRFPVFARAIEKCSDVLKPRGINLMDIITTQNKAVFGNIINSFVGVAAIQIALVDLLSSVGLAPDHIIGHSIGELGCAYADKCLTLEETILTAYFQGLALSETESMIGSTADIKLGYADLKKMCPPDIDIVHHNNSKNSTISGPTESVKRFVDELKKHGIDATQVNWNKPLYHSRYIRTVTSRIVSYLQNIIKDPKRRSSKWYSTSIPKNQWSIFRSKFCSAEYFANNLSNPVLLEEITSLMPKDTIVIGIAPNNGLQSVLEDCTQPETKMISLTQLDGSDAVTFLLQALGDVHNLGVSLKLQNLYPKIEFPVSRGTPMISPLIKWNHERNWHIVSWKLQSQPLYHRTLNISPSQEDYLYMNGHVIDGRHLVPATGYLLWMWEAVVRERRDFFTEQPVVIENIKFFRATHIPPKGQATLTFNLHQATGRCEITDGDTVVVTGDARIAENISEEKMKLGTCFEDDEEEIMTTKDVYKELKLRGYQYSGLYRGIKSATVKGTKGHIIWRYDWVAFIDNMLQMMMLGIDTRGLYVPTAIRKIVIDPKAHWEEYQRCTSEEKAFPVRVYQNFNVIKSGGVEIHGAKANAIARKRPLGDPVLEEYKFVAHRDQAEIPLRDMVRLSTHLALENHEIIKVKTLEVIDEGVLNPPIENLLSPLIVEALGDLPLIQANVIVTSNVNHFEEGALPQTIQFTEWKKLPTDKNIMIAIGNELLSDKKSDRLKRLLLILREGGFLITKECTTDVDLSYIQQLRLHVVLEKRYGEGTILLLKKHKVPTKTKVVYVNNKEFSWLEEIKSIIKNEQGEGTEDLRIILVGEEVFDSGILGLANCLRKEPGGEMIRCVLIQDPMAPKFCLNDPLYREQLQIDLPVNVLGPNGVWGSYRHLLLPPLEKKLVDHAYVTQMVRGDLNSLRWVEGPLRFRECEYPVHIVYASLNFRDIVSATGRIAIEFVAPDRREQQCVLGFEYSGIDVNGRRVMGMTEHRCLANMRDAEPLFCWEIPDHWSLEDAATVPAVYMTNFYALYLVGKMKKGDKILIHAGTGGVGQSAINLALHQGCEVFTTVGTPDKRRFIRETFPSIDDDHIGNSRDTSFEELIMRQTKGRGVDIVLNSLSEEKLQASVRCLAPGGKFLEIGKFDLAADNILRLGVFSKGISFHGIMLDTVFGTAKDHDGKIRAWRKELSDLFKDQLKTSAIKPLNRTVFSKDEVETAFRFMGSGKHIGKVLIKVNDETDLPFQKPLEAMPRYHCLEERSYVLLGGLGGFGLELADWLVMRGAKNLVLSSRNGIKNGYQRMRVEIWKSYGTNVTIVVGKDASNREDCEFILKTAAEMGPIDAIFNLAVVLKDGLCENQTVENFAESFKPKAWATMMLDELSRDLCPKLRHFVIFSSVSCGRGNAGQINYGMANSVMERICERRAKEGLPATAIQWGAIGEVGLVADMQENDKELIIGGTLQQKITSCLQELEGFLLQNKPIVSSMVVAEKRSGSGSASTPIEAVMNMMGVKDLKNVSTQTKLSEIGMDSMTAVEIKQTLEREFEIYLTAQDIRDLTFGKLIEMSATEKDDADENVTQNNGKSKAMGLGLFIRLLSAKEIVTNVCMELPTPAEADSCEMFLVPGIEGVGSSFLPVAPSLKHKATCLQLGLNIYELNTVEAMADYLFPHMMARMKQRRDFVIVGYSFGSLIAIELVRKLEAQNCKGQLILIDGSPKIMKTFLEEQFSDPKSNEEIHNSFLLKMMGVITPDSIAEFETDLEECTTYDEKLERFMSKMPADNSFISAKNGKMVCTAMCNRLIACKMYVSLTNFTSITTPIKLIKCTTDESILDEDAEEQKSDLRKVTRGEIEVHHAEGNHITILENPKVIAALNAESLENIGSPLLSSKTLQNVPPFEHAVLESTKPNIIESTHIIESHTVDKQARS